MRVWVCLLLSWIVLASSMSVRSQEDYQRALSIETEVRRIASQRTLWPGFDPVQIPLAIFTGQNTYLFRHPSPPAEFSKRDGFHVFHGRYPFVTSNTSVDINGIPTATLMAEYGDVAIHAAVSLHEAFHVHQRARHPHWIANEGSVFLYPTDNAELLSLRRMESVAFSRALRAADIGTAAEWCELALQYRLRRFSQMDSAFGAYERFNELNEGLAQYIQHLAAGHNSVHFPAEEFKPAAIRERVYVSGPALAFLLDRLDPDWQKGLEKNDRQFLDDLLRRAIQG